MDELVRRVIRTRFLVFLGVVFVICAVYVWLENNRTTAARVQSRVTPSAAVPITQRPTTSSVTAKKFDLNKNYTCKNGSSNIVISQKRFYAENTKEKIPSYTLFSGDCIYMWKKNTTQGVKKCGYGQYVSMYEMFSKMGVVDADTILSAISGSGMLDFVNSGSGSAKMPSGNAVANTFAKSCTQVTSVDNKLFTIPLNVKFVEQKQT